MHKIGVLDSGIGGLTTCIYILRQNPHINIIYYSDNKNAPYGTKTNEEVISAVKTGVEYLLSEKVELIVIACNTATAVAIKEIRRITNIPIVGTEPEVKNADANALILATPLTQKSKGIVHQNFDTTYLSEIIEKSFLDEKILQKIGNKINDQNADVILGCTHYVYLRPYIKSKILDGGNGVSKRVISLLPNSYDAKFGKIYLHFSGDKEFTKYIKAVKTFRNFCEYTSK